MSKLDPEIRWTKERCPLCAEPTGLASKCHELPQASDSDERIKAISTLSAGKAPISTYSLSCVFRLRNVWLFETNNPIPSEFIKDLWKITGVTEIMIDLPYRGKIVIGNLFDELAIQKEITVLYKTTIKARQVSAASGLSSITLPNGKVYSATTPDVSGLVDEMVSEFKKREEQPPKGV